MGGGLLGSVVQVGGARSIGLHGVHGRDKGNTS